MQTAVLIAAAYWITLGAILLVSAISGRPIFGGSTLRRIKPGELVGTVIGDPVTP